MGVNIVNDCIHTYIHISAEHFVFAHSRIHVLLSLLFSVFITHGYLPGMFMKTAIVPIIKNKTGDTSDKNNYRPIALVTAASKIFELCLSVILENYLLFWYSKQTVCVKWGRCISDYFSISNGVRQGGILSPKLFSVYVDDLSDKLVESKVGCSIDNLCMNHVMYADDSCLMAPSPASFTGIN